MNNTNLLIAVGTKNPVKLQAVQDAFVALFPEITIDVQACSADSGVSDQPMSTGETIEGARNRAIHALNLLPNADFGVGLEGGMFREAERIFDIGWVVVRSKNGIEGMGSTLSMEVAPSIISYMKENTCELGTAMDFFFHSENTKQHLGHFGSMTNGQLNRARPFTDAVMSALTRFLYVNMWK